MLSPRGCLSQKGVPPRGARLPTNAGQVAWATPSWGRGEVHAEGVNPPDAKDVYVLGAGFSRAISDHMPLLDELGAEIMTRLDDGVVPHALRLAPEQFELWLSYLAGDQPWLDEAERLRNRALLVAVSRVLADVIMERELRSRSGPMPEWLPAMVARWHEDRATVITFNYDTLVEAAYTAAIRVRSRPDAEDNYVSHAQLQRSPLTPIGSRAGSVLTASQIDTFKLVKLHGSRSWVYSGRPSFFGESIYDTCRVQGWSPEKPDPQPWLSQDKVPLIVPPTAGKTGFFENETIQAEWRQAFRSLRQARRIYVAGYSFPPSDLLVRFLLQHGCSDGAQLTVANPDRSVATRLSELLESASVATRVHEVANMIELSKLLPPLELNPLVILTD